jgi:hypothetical protein
MKCVSAQEVRDAALSAKITHVNHHRCSICDSMVGYYIENGDLFFDSMCDCTSLWSQPQECLWQEAADWINMQTDVSYQEEIMKSFGM